MVNRCDAPNCSFGFGPVQSNAKSAEPLRGTVGGSSLFPEVGAYEATGRKIGRLVDTKNRAYGDAFGKTADFLKLLYPYGVSPDRYRDVLTVTRIFDKLMRVAHEQDAFGESPFVDIAGYAILAVNRRERDNGASQGLK